MSFSLEVKNEVAAHEYSGNDARAELSAIIQMCAALSIQNRHMALVVHVENAAVARTIYKLVKERYQVDIALSLKRKMNLHKNMIYGLTIKEKAKDILEDLGLYSTRGLLPKPLSRIVHYDTNARAYLTGAFMASGSINPPQKTSYHLEITANNQEHGHFLVEQMERFGIIAKMIERRHKHVVYVKSSEKIADFLRIINANEAVLNFENIRISRDFTNSLTRLNNCDVANEVKIQAASLKQLNDIALLDSHDRSRHLDEKLQRVMKLRKENPEVSLLELCGLYEERYQEPVSKSGMKHRFDKIHSEAEKMKEIKSHD